MTVQMMTSLSPGLNQATLRPHLPVLEADLSRKNESHLFLRLGQSLRRLVKNPPKKSKKPTLSSSSSSSSSASASKRSQSADQSKTSKPLKTKPTVRDSTMSVDQK